MFLPFGVALVAALQSIVASTTNVELQSTCNTYTVSGIPGGFQQRTQADFSGVTSGQDAAAILSCVILFYIYLNGKPDSGRPTQH